MADETVIVKDAQELAAAIKNEAQTIVVEGRIEGSRRFVFRKELRW